MNHRLFIVYVLIVSAVIDLGLVYRVSVIDRNDEFNAWVSKGVGNPPIPPNTILLLFMRYDNDTQDIWGRRIVVDAVFVYVRGLGDEQSAYYLLGRFEYGEVTWTHRHLMTVKISGGVDYYD